MSRRTPSSGRWLQEHFADPFVRRAQAEGWRSRAVYKLAEADRKDRLLRPGMTVAVEINTGTRRVIDYVLSPLLRYAQESLRER